METILKIIFLGMASYPMTSEFRAAANGEEIVFSGLQLCHASGDCLPNLT